MSKLVAIYNQPVETNAFDEAYFKSHRPLIAKVPGLQQTIITRFPRTLVGDDVYLMAEMYFSDSDALKDALRSPQMAAAGENLNSFARDKYTLAIGVEDTASTNPPQGSMMSSQAE